MARIFIAIRFGDKFKKNLVEIPDTLRARDVQGNYCPYENLHMTLAFIGEKHNLSVLREAVNKETFEPFLLSTSNLGTCPTKSGVIRRGVKENDALTTLVQTALACQNRHIRNEPLKKSIRR